MVYFPTRQPPVFTASPHAIAVRVTGDPDDAISRFARRFSALSLGYCSTASSTMSAALGRDVARERLIAYLASRSGSSRSCSPAWGSMACCRIP